MRPGLVAGSVLAVATIVGVALSVLACSPTGALFFTAYAGVGAVLAYRRPTNSIGWLLVVIALGLASGNVRLSSAPAALQAGQLSPTEALLAWLQGWGYGLAFVGITGLSLVFPSGRLPAGRSGRAGLAALVAVMAITAMIAFGPLISVTASTAAGLILVPNPAAVLPGSPFWASIPPPDGLFTGMTPFLGWAVLTVFLRYRRSTGLERLQYRWLAAAAAAVVISSALWAILTIGLQGDPQGPAFFPALVAYPLLPVAILIAVLRYRLYEIDRIVSRTVGWTTASVAIAVVFVAGIVVLQTILSGMTGGQSLATAGSTLMAAVLFQPLRRRIQARVDERFDRPRLRAEATIGAYTGRLGREVDLATIATDLRTTILAGLRPSEVDVWMRGRPERLIGELGRSMDP